jgi:hypothetical protein
MQMFYADFTWYGAGAIRFGFKNNRGEVIYCHRIVNNNNNTEAYMRSGNVPARYETNTFAARTFLASTLAAGATSMTVNDTTLFPPVGTLVVSAAASAGGAIEYIYYTGKTATTFTGLQRNSANTGGIALGTSTATTFTFSATAPILVESFSPAQASTISHWGSSVIMDGRFDDDNAYLFTQNSQTLNIAGTTAKSFASTGINLTTDLMTVQTHGFRSGDLLQFESIGSNGLRGSNALHPATQIIGSNTSATLTNGARYKAFVNSANLIHLTPENATITVGASAARSGNTVTITTAAAHSAQN